MTVLSLHQISKNFRGNPALLNVDFTLNKGEVHAILGENGAGKSTLTKIIAGVLSPSSGTIKLDGRSVRFSSPKEAKEAGIAMVFQETSLVPSMTVAQNLYLGEERPFNSLRRTQIRAQEFLQSLNFPVDPSLDAAMLGAAERQMVEIARAVLSNAKIIIFDEPTASLTPEEKAHFFALIRRLTLRGVSIIFISHAIEESLEIADQITVLCDGKTIAQGARKSFDRDLIVNAMVGRDAHQTDNIQTKKRVVRKRGDKVLSVQNLSMGNAVSNTSFSIYAGQVTGLFGLVGSGRTETAKIIAGIFKRKTFLGGKIILNDRAVRYRTPRQAIKDGVVYVTEDRKVEGFFDTMSISQNLWVNHASAGNNPKGVVSLGLAQKLTDIWSEKLNIKGLAKNAQVIELSGGNQQKVVIARALLQKPKLVIFDEPTKGVDVGAIAQIHAQIEKLADAGIGVIVISSYLPELLGLCDRILVNKHGRVVEEFDGNSVSAKEIMFSAVH